ncbi:response regulator [Caldinitratiruptor microaerophilus]|uniref:Stage 0 sporulation protein A homolog n=1 Tax=Caldinitratiruptor microaerophilus TaxID=671077 RepID=A0AA35G6I9_9FIRM|nr:response regulator [Caldinitratiruptor microaerophilus]BDG61381.1 response regulator [Caldinitratiruptor microaerophilus]
MKRILVVDDSNMTRKMVISILSREGYQVDSAGNGLEALERLYQTAYDLVITDINMPQMDGLEFLRQVRQESQYGRLPVLVLSSNSSPEEVQRTMRAGASLYLIKPAPPEKLLESVRALLKAG